jgi:hypothetical protein
MHFEDKAWVDFVRKLLTDDETWLMQQHLAIGCGECSQACAFWTRVTDMTARDSDYEPPTSDVSRITAAFIGQNREKTVRDIYTPAQLVFDSFHMVADAGFRSALLQARHLVFRASPWTISLRIKSESGNQVFMAGQITRAEPAGLEPGAMQEVALAESDSLVATATSNHSGEFHLQYRDALDLRLLVKVSEAETLEISLPDQDPVTEEFSFGE